MSTHPQQLSLVLANWIITGYGNTRLPGCLNRACRLRFDPRNDGDISLHRHIQNWFTLILNVEITSHVPVNIMFLCITTMPNCGMGGVESRL